MKVSPLFSDDDASGPKTERQIMESRSLARRSLGGSTPAVVAKVSYFRDEGSRDAEFHIKPLGDRRSPSQDPMQGSGCGGESGA